ncbi:hypothetical protein TraAM80_03788 [Trypanosoma rangeli]|uniref:Uncharacterized protein n=1 Tax=Trypanosoma rangeli TaxID=5698 RepID=A0A3R7RMA0_TRYRA|nr:uncharacterized protein TraAM80_03788 [Trypanosoma rangeli]RNF06957.1 hypothetical protein TraAM80_03788 [Trypanosoma rangeli]|eukprot:RNF06957.1 hypothetical protein TraAM80_03788 [Trypanosoma rangeli]
MRLRFLFTAKRLFRNFFSMSPRTFSKVITNVVLVLLVRCGLSRHALQLRHFLLRERLLALVKVLPHHLFPGTVVAKSLSADILVFPRSLLYLLGVQPPKKPLVPLLRHLKNILHRLPPKVTLLQGAPVILALLHAVVDALYKRHDNLVVCRLWWDVRGGQERLQLC